MNPADADTVAQFARARSLTEGRRLSIHVDSRTAEALESLTLAAGVTKAEAVREAIATYLAAAGKTGIWTPAEVLSVKENDYAKLWPHGTARRETVERDAIGDQDDASADSGSQLLANATARSLTFSTSALIIPRRRVETGTLIRTVSYVWHELALQLSKDWSRAFELPPETLEELVAGAFKKDGFDEVILTPRSGDHGRDIIAVKWGIGSIKILGSVKRYAAARRVRYDEVRALAGVLHGDQSSSKGMLITTSDFPKRIVEDPFIKPLLPTRLELVNGAGLQVWIDRLLRSA